MGEDLLRAERIALAATWRASRRDASERNCRYCYDRVDTPFVPGAYPCQCRGDLAHVHAACLAEWVGKKSDRFVCELCKTRYDLSCTAFADPKQRALVMAAFHQRERPPADTDELSMHAIEALLREPHAHVVWRARVHAPPQVYATLRIMSLAMLAISLLMSTARSIRSIRVLPGN